MNLESLAVGDQAAIRTGFGYPSYQLVTVDHITQTQIHAKGRKFNRGTGKVIGSGDRWTPVSLVPLTPELKDELRAKELRSDLKHSINWDSIPLQSLESIVAIIKQSRTPS